MILTENQHVMLDLVAVQTLPAAPDLEQIMKPMWAMQLVTLNSEGRWQITDLGEATLARVEGRLH